MKTVVHLLSDITIPTVLSDVSYSIAYALQFL